jgi:hypothetical protein
LAGDAAVDVLKVIGIQVGRKSFTKVLESIPGRVLIQINKQVGYRLLTKFGEEGVINLARAIPIGGGIVGGAVDAAFCRAVGNTAIKVFKPAKSRGRSRRSRRRNTRSS